MKYQKITAAILSTVLITGSVKVPIYAKSTTQKTAETTYKAAALLNESADKSMNAAWEMCIDTIKKNGYDYALTTASFDETKQNTEPIDTYGLLSAYMAAKKVIEANGRRAVKIYDIPLVEFTYEEQKEEVYAPTKIDAYNLQSDGTYIKEGTYTILSPIEVAIYEQEGNHYKDTGKRKEVIPDLKEAVYADVSLSYITPEKLCEKMGVSFAKIEEEYKRRRNLLEHKTNQDTMIEMAALKLPEYVDITNYLKTADSITDDLRRMVVKNAINLIGQVPYEYGGKPQRPGYDTTWWTYDEEKGKQKGLDCSGFVKWSFMTAGKDDVLSYLTSTSTMKESGIKRIALEELKPGDIGVTNHGGIEHCGIYLAPGKWIHCSSAAGTVTVSDKDIGFTVFLDPYADTENYDAFEKTGNPEGYTEDYGEDLETENTEPDADAENQNETNDAEGNDAQTEQSETFLGEDDTQTGQNETLSTETDAETGMHSVSENTVVPGEQNNANRYDISESIDNDKRTYYTNEYSEDDMILLAKLIRHEAGSEGINGKVAVAEVVKNRLTSAIFPNTMKEVIYQDRQFTNSSELAKINHTDEDLTIAKMVLSGNIAVLNNENVLYFKNPMITDGIPPEVNKDWGKHTWFKAEGNHAFYIQ